MLTSRIALTASLCLLALHLAANETEEIVVVGTSPGPGLGIDADKMPFYIQLIGASELDNAQSLDLTDYLASHIGSVSIMSAQNNPLQPDLQFRGFTASPLLGLPQGIAVYQNGVRITEPLGDAVNWDLLPESAVSSMQVMSGANPLFGLNALGGSLIINMKDGFTYDQARAEISGGSWDRLSATLELGGNNGAWGYYGNLSYFEEQGWRDLSPSTATNFYGSLGWRDGKLSALNFNVQLAQSDLHGNGTVPVGLLAMDRTEIFTAPDTTENDMQMFSLDGTHFLSETIQLAGSAYWRKNTPNSFNGDGSEFLLCNFAGGAQSLFEEADDTEDALQADLGIDLDGICEGNEPTIMDFDDLKSLIEHETLIAGLDLEDYELEDVAGEISGSGILSDEAVNNISQIKQESRGFDTKLIFLNDLAGKANFLTFGLGWYKGNATFDSIVELSRIDPVTRSTAGLGLGAWFDEGEIHVRTVTDTLSLYIVNTMELMNRLSLTLGGRYNDVDVTLRDSSGERPELNGDHTFNRFNPMVGLTYDLGDTGNLYASYSESNRVPTPIELACNEGVFEIAQQFAIERGDDPNDIELECRLPNAFLADPPLDDVITRSFEIGVRGSFRAINYHAGLFHTVNTDDILFQTTGRATGLFANVDKTQRSGIETSLEGSLQNLNWYANYTWLRATFEDDFDVLSPNHPNADDKGVIFVESGDHIPGMPGHMFKVGGEFFFSDHFSVGAELVYNGDIYLRGDESNDLDQIDGYTVVSLLASYRWKGLTVFGRVTNLFDNDYENFGLLGEEPGELLGNLTDNRPIFLGPGSPRAAWLGVRYGF